MIASAVFVSLALAADPPKDLPKERPKHPVDRAFSLNRTSTGYIAAGNLAGTLYAFHVRGHELKYLGTASPPAFSIDGVVMQVKLVPRAAFGGPPAKMLETHKRFEQDHLAGTAKGMTFRDHDMCRRAKFPYQQWLAESAGNISQAFVTFEVGDYVVMVVAPYENERRRQLVASAIGDVCESFGREKAS